MTSPSQSVRDMIDQLNSSGLKKAKSRIDENADALTDPDTGLVNPHLDDLKELLDLPDDAERLAALHELMASYLEAGIEAVRRLREIIDLSQDADEKDRLTDRVFQWVGIGLRA